MEKKFRLKIVRKENLESKNETLELKEKLDLLKKKAKEVSEKIKEKYQNLEINNEGRITIPESDKQTVLKVSKIKESFKSKKEDKKIEILGEALELFKFVKINDEDSKFITLRTSEYDDFINHIDEIIYHKNTLEPIMAIDVTTTSNEDIQLNKLSKFIKILNEGGGKVKYGFICTKDENGNISFKRSKLSQIPVFIVHMTVNELLKKVEDKEFNFTNWLENLINSQLPLINQIIEAQTKIATGEYKEKLENLKEKYINLKLE